MKALCRKCKWAKEIDPETRLALGQENKEILNALLHLRYKTNEFLYCTKYGWLESAIVKKECSDWEYVEK